MAIQHGARPLSATPMLRRQRVNAGARRDLVGSLQSGTTIRATPAWRLRLTMMRLYFMCKNLISVSANVGSPADWRYALFFAMTFLSDAVGRSDASGTTLGLAQEVSDCDGEIENRLLAIALK